MRTGEEIARMVEAAPFGAFADGGDATCYVAFLAAPPRTPLALPLANPKEALEAVAIGEREVFLLSRRKADGSSGNPNAFVERASGVAATTRNWSTVRKMAAL